MHHHQFALSRAPFRLTLCAALLAALGAPGHAQQKFAASTFNQEFLGIGGDQPTADLSLFAFGNRVTAGTYLVDVTLNERGVGQSEVRFVEQEGKNDAVPCLTRGLLEAWGVNVPVFPALATASDEACIDLGSVIPDSAVSYDGGKQRLYVSIPQAALKRSARGAVGPEKWDKGITAGMLDYQLSYGHNTGSNYNNNLSIQQQLQVQQNILDGNAALNNNLTGNQIQRETFFAGLRAGFNAGDWRFRNYSTYNSNVAGQGRWQSINSYVQRDLASIKGQLLVGEGATPGNFFDSVQFRGAQIASDDAMLPDSMQGYAPTIRGVAQTNARVTVRQNGYVVYSTFVAPGAFVLDDLYPTASSGDLEVTITEADGRQTRYIQAFSAVPTLLREGTWRYAATAGKYRNGYSDLDTSYGGSRPALSQPYFAQGTLARGMGNEFSLYGGLTAANMYQAVLAGVGKNLRDFGAVSVDLTSARTTDRNDDSSTGESLRFLYAKSFISSGTNFRVAGYRYSTSGYRTFQEAVQVQDLSSAAPFNNRRNELRLDLSQQIADKGSVFVSARQQSYWGTSATDRLVQVGYSGNYKQFGYSVFYNYSTNLNAPSNRQITVMLTIPLGNSRANAQYSVTHDNNGRVNQQVGLYGSAFDDSRLTYNVMAGDSNQQGANGSASASYLSPVGRFDLGQSQGRGYGQTTFGMSGGLLVHGGGATLSQPLGETMALVRVPKAQGVGLESQAGVMTDGQGQAVIANLSPYRINRVALRTGDLGDTVEVKNAAMDVVPTRGAVVLAKFETSVGLRLLMTLTGPNGKVLPLGSKIENEAGQEVGIVGPDGQAFVTGAASSGQLKVIWGHGDSDQCTVPYSLPDEEQPPPIRQLDGQCAAPAAPDAPGALATPVASGEAKPKE